MDYFSSLVLDFHRALIFKSFPVKQPLNDLVACLLRLGHVNHYDLLFVDDLVSCLEELLIDLLRLPVVFLDLLELALDAPEYALLLDLLRRLLKILNPLYIYKLLAYF